MKSSILERCLESLKGRSLTVDVLAALFGIGSWVAVNGLWVQLPLLVQSQPEGWSLPSYLSVIIQVANLGPLLYGTLSRVASRVVTPSRTIWIVLSIGVIASILMPFLWRQTAHVFGGELSVALLTLSLALSLVDCTSSVLFLPYIGLFRSTYLTSYMLGEGLSALLPSVVATIQGVGVSSCVNSTNPEYPGIVEQLEPPLFSTEVFFGTLAAMMVVSAIAFGCMEWLPQCKKERATEHKEKKREEEENNETEEKHGLLSLCLVLALQFWLSLWANGFLMSVQSYSCLPYGREVFHWAVILANAANPVACLFALAKPCLSLRGLAVLGVAGSAVSVYLLWTAGASPLPPLVNTQAGGIIVVLAWIVYMGLTCYTKVSAACILRQTCWRSTNRMVHMEEVSSEKEDFGKQLGNGLIKQADSPVKARSNVENRLFYYGVATQAGSLLGSVIAFLLVNIFIVFKASQPCQGV